MTELKRKSLSIILIRPLERLSGSLTGNVTLGRTVMIANAIKNWNKYPYGDAWKLAFSFIEKLHPDFPIGEFEIKGADIFARVMEYETLDKETAVLESHRRYIDIQTTLVGAEGMLYAPVDDISIKTPYDAEKDMVFYHHPTVFSSRIDVNAGLFVVFFPHDAHMPQLIVNQKELIKKAVVKIRTDLLFC